MKQSTFDLDLLVVGSDSSKFDNSEKEILLNNLFKPPKYDTNYFYYTEVFSDWLREK
jgi:hypothetical protein